MISIIMSVYNVGKYLEDCLSSIFNQTYKEFEVIIINDGSTDNSVKIINKYREKHSNIVYLEQQNKGLSEARNLGLSLAKGEYILYIDSDDYIDQDMFRVMIEKIESDKSDMVIIGHTEFYDDVTGKDCHVKLEIQDNKIYSGIEVANLMLECKVMGVAWNKLYKTEKLKEENFYFEIGRYTQDWYPTFKHIANLEKISFVNLPLYKYRLRSTSTTSKKNKKRLEDYYYAVSSILDYVEQNKSKFNENSINKFKCITLNNLLRLISSICTMEEHGGYSEAQRMKLDCLNIKVLEIFRVENLSWRIKVYLIGWKLKVYKIVLNSENLIRKIIRR